MKRLTKTVILTILTVFYIFIANDIFNILIYLAINNNQIENTTKNLQTFGINLDISSSISFNPVVERPRFYGTFYEFYYDEYNYNYLLLFNLIKVPISVNGFSFLLIHFFMTLFIILFILIL